MEQVQHKRNSRQSQWNTGEKQRNQGGVRNTKSGHTRNTINAVAVANTVVRWFANDHKVAGNTVDTVGIAAEAREGTRECRIKMVTVRGKGLLGCYQRLHAVYL